MQSTTTGGRTLGHAYTRIGGAWVDITGNGTVLSVGTTAPISGGTITTTGSIGITQAGVATDGYLSSTDWNTFNNKGSGTIGGSIASPQVAFGTGADTIGGDAGLTWDNTGKTLAVKNNNCSQSYLTLLDTDFSSDLADGLAFTQCDGGFGQISTGAGSKLTANQGLHVDLSYPDRTMQFYPAGSSGYAEFDAAIPPSGTTYSQFALKLFARKDANNYVNPEIDFHAWDGTDTALGFELAMEGTQSGTALSGQHFYLYDYQAAATVFSYTTATSTWTFFQQLSMDTGKGIFAQGGVFGGSGTGSTLLLQSTTGVGATDSISFKVGNNGAVTAATIDTAGAVNMPLLTASKCVRTDASKNLASSTGDCLTSSTAVTSIAKSGSTALHGDVTVTGTTPIVATQASQNLDFSCATCGVTGSPLSQFAATTSSQFAGVISDETGTAGKVVFDTDPTLVRGVMSGTPAAAGALGYDSTRGVGTAYNGAEAQVVYPCRVLSVSRPNETKSNSTTNDQDYTSLFTIPSNFIIAQRVLRISLQFAVTTDASASTQLYYLKLGSTKVVAQQTAITPANNLTLKGFHWEYQIYGTAAAGSSVAVESTVVNANFSTAGQANADGNFTVNVATNGNLTVVPGIAFGSNTNGESSVLKNAMIEACN